MDSHSMLRLSLFIGIFGVMALAEALWPARQAVVNKALRWRANLAMVVCGALVGRVVLPASVAGVALWAQQHSIGVLHHIAIPGWLSVVLAVLWLDLVIYWQHRLFHRIPLLWQLHKVHHADSHVDTTTGLRFHPLEIGLSLLVKSAAVLLLGAPAVAVLIFEVALNGFALFNHSNIRLPQALDDKLGRLIITQRLHRIHHSQYGRETNSNYGFSVSWWDRLFNSFTHRAEQTDEQLDIGLTAYPATPANSRFVRLLMMPFRRS
ncbi:sterol desaturase family protein [Salinimonas lutimaris]|uniref:sterol desaturase family protein n=1 Tax=Salinimonas lutimaris TaxID=914153 RepID=UPI0010BF815C|nr:sterol desaturase family protein [Salinimonas lutimaris]